MEPWQGDAGAELGAVDEATRDQWVAGSEDFHAEPQNALAVRALLDALAFEPADQVLELGTGVGTVAGLIAPRVPKGRVLAIDNAAPLIEKARARLREVPTVEFAVADARGTALPERSFDVVCAVELLVHCGPMSAVLADALRVLKPGGRIGFLHAGPLFGHLPQPHLAGLALGAMNDSNFDRLAGARLEGALRAAGFRDVRPVHSVASCLDLTRKPWADVLASVAEVAVQLEAVDRAQADAWLDEVAQGNKQNKYMLAAPLFGVVGRAPGLALRRK